jgi:hypothetical protein
MQRAQRIRLTRAYALQVLTAAANFSELSQYLRRKTAIF